MKQPVSDDFERCLKENQRVVYQIAYTVLRNTADAEDVAQEAFIRAHARIDQLRDPQQFRAWICTIVRRLALNRVRAQSRARAREALALPADADTAADVEQMAHDRVFVARVRSEIDRLPPKLREVLLLTAIDDLDHATVAKILRVPEGTVRSRLHAARQALMRAIEP